MSQSLLDTVGIRAYLKNPYIGDYLDFQVWILLKLYFLPYEILENLTDK